MWAENGALGLHLIVWQINSRQLHETFREFSPHFGFQKVLWD